MTSTQIYSNMNCIRHIILRLLDHPRLQLHQKPIIYIFLKKLHFTTLNYILNYTLHPEIKFVVNLDRNLKFRMQNVIGSIVQGGKCNFSFAFKELRKQTIRSFHVIPCFSIQVNNKLKVRMQSITMIKIQGEKCAFKKFRVQSVISGKVQAGKV